MHEPIKTGEPADRKSREALFTLAQWVGRREAFGLISGRCSASEVEILRKIRDEQLYEESGLSWDAFCSEKLHASRRNVEREIGYLRKHGPVFFVIRQITRIGIREYEAIASHISEQGVNLDGKLIAASPENSEELTAAVGELVKRSEADLPASQKAMPPFDSLLRQIRGTAGTLRGFTEALSDEQKTELAEAVAEVRAGAILLGAM